MTFAARICVFALSVLMAASASAQFNRVYLDPTTGRVGYHMSIGMLTPLSDLPRSNGRVIEYDTCSHGMGRYAYSGEMPPGIKMAVGGQPVFTGTPRQPGTWRGTLNYSVKCTAGPDQNTYVRTIPVTWIIEP